MGKRGPILNSQSRELVIKLHKYFEQESQNGGPLIPVTRVQERVANALGIGKKTVNRIVKEKYGPSGTEDNEMHTPKRRMRVKPELLVIDADAPTIYPSDDSDDL